jgi:hypothetical protein
VDGDIKSVEVLMAASAISGHTAGATDIAPTTEELRGSETGASPFNLKIQ